MKLNWGKGIILAIALFMGFILFFVIKIQTNSAYNHEMVYEEYYKTDAAYDGQIKKMANAVALDTLPKLVNSKQQLKINFPDSYNFKQAKVSFYRPSGKKLDFEKTILKSDSSLLIPKSQLAGGRWDIAIEWEMNGKEYLIKEVMYL